MGLKNKKPRNVGEYYLYSEAERSKTNKVPVKRGCKNKVCFCSGKCNDIVGWRDKLPGEV